jgi:hypothetical protein
MELVEHRPTYPRFTLFRELAESSRTFWSPARVRLALAFTAGMLVLEILVAAAFYAGADGQFGRAPLAVHRVASFLSLNAPWAKALFRSTEQIEMPPFPIGRSLRDPFAVTSNFLRDVAGITVTWLLPIFAAIAFTAGTAPTIEGRPAKKLLFRSLAVVGPLALMALVLTAASSVVHTIFATLAAPPLDPSLYPIQRFLQAPWGSVGFDLQITGPRILAPFLLIPTVAAAWRDRQQSLAACLGTSLFLVPLIEIPAVSLYPGGVEAIPPFVVMHGGPLINLALFVLMLPFALKTLQSDRTLPHLSQRKEPSLLPRADDGTYPGVHKVRLDIPSPSGRQAVRSQCGRLKE